MINPSGNISLKFSTCVTSGCNSIQFFEETGQYSTTNTTGYGYPNMDNQDAFTAELTVTTPSNVTETFDILPLGFPTRTPDLTFDVPLTYEDGKWIFTYTITDGSDTYTLTKYSYFYCTTECCVTNKLANITTIGCDSCKDSLAEKEYIKMFIMLESLKKAAKCGDETTFIYIKKIIDKLCKNNNCNTCK